MYLNKGPQNECFTGKFPKMFTKTNFFEMLVMGAQQTFVGLEDMS